jgi:predicted nucleic acid-binding protein
MIYADTSVIAALVLQDAKTRRAADLLAGSVEPLLFNGLLSLEVCNVIRLAVGRGDIDEVGARAAEGRVLELRSAGMLELFELDWERVFQRSLGFGRAHTSVIKTRSFDIVHVAAAVELGATRFWSFDKRQRTLAQEVGLRINH